MTPVRKLYAISFQNLPAFKELIRNFQTCMETAEKELTPKEYAYYLGWVQGTLEAELRNKEDSS